ncbi:fumarylacetoacetate hydrolase family protein [Reichenbachiella agarivorans]|uniref:Fumarylacetoacetate hydrolase family protein n=1 Tax=Reichenbachiella agarivorans TaxID=2979464 RepID=A0ABY6CQ35_9BACT|nr:fumarylacetoacetate hydrolase family protein [Reichenbachiella agarivorans]UXP32630.1 fumarylacetoacetate hydrolase family protein [Reichenbachiella agarivorans]
MKLFRYRQDNQVLPGVSVGDVHYDLSQHIKDIDRDFFDHNKVKEVQSLLDSQSLKTITNPEFDAPIYRPGKIICIGLNYRKHAEESGMEVPKEPVVFFKATSSLCGPNDDVVIPKGSQKSDWEVELAVVIGKTASYVSEADAMNYVLGYALHNDVSERAFQLERGGQWVKGKSCDTFAPLGPYIVTADEVADPHNLNLWLKLNGKKIQDGYTSDFVFDIPTVISYLSQFMTLEPGDIISTGTPAGVGLGFNPPVYLKPGDVMELGIDGLGTSKQTAVAYSGQ